MYLYNTVYNGACNLISRETGWSDKRTVFLSIVIFMHSFISDIKWQNQLPSSDFNTFKEYVNSTSGPYWMPFQIVLMECCDIMSEFVL
jgi:hypothetical protein